MNQPISDTHFTLEGAIQTIEKFHLSRRDFISGVYAQIIDQLSSPQKAEQAYDYFSDSDYVYLSKMGTILELLFDKWLSLCQTSEDTETLYYKINTKYPKDDQLDRLFAKWDDFDKSDIEKAQTVSDLIKILSDIRPKSPHFELCREKLTSIYTTEVIQKITTSAQGKKAWQNAPTEAAKEASLVKWSEVSWQEVKAATTLEAIWQADKNIPSKSKAEKLSYSKQNDIVKRKITEAKTLETVKRALKHALKGSESERLGLTKLDSLIIKRAKKINDPYDLKLLLPDCPDGSESEKFVCTKLYQLADISDS